MSEPNLEPTPRGWIEKACASSFLTILPPALVLAMALNPLSDEVGYWPALAILVPAGIAFSIVISLPLIPIQRQRAALDAQRGIFECAHRERGSSLKGRWARGYAKAEPGRLLFQAKSDVTGRPSGPIEIYSEPKAIGLPVKAPWSVSRRWRVITLSTDKGIVELAAAPSSLNLLAEGCLNGD
jgi:hypothetical protein